MSWFTQIVEDTCVGMEVTSHDSAGLSIDLLIALFSLDLP